MINLISSLLIFIIVLLILSWITHESKKDKKHLIDYYSFFSLGIVWTVLGIITKDYVFTITGIIFGILGLRHQEEWDSEHYAWKQLSNKERQKIKEYLAILTILLIILLALYIYLEL